MVPEILRESERRLRKAIERRQYGDLPRLLEDFRLCAEEHLQPETAEEIRASMRATMEWARLMVATQRQIWADESQRLPMVNRYLDRSPESLPAICLDL